MKNIYKLLHSFGIITVVTCLFFTTPAKADTTFVSGDIVNQNWRIAGSPYVVTNNVRIVGLSIDPGVSVLFGGNYEFLVEGIIEAIGSEQAQIIFTTKAGTTSWKGIRFQNSSFKSYMKWCIIEKANNSGIQVIESLPNISYCIFRNNQSPQVGGGLKISNTITLGTLFVKNCNFENNLASTNGTFAAGGGVYMDPGNADFLNCQFLKNRVETQFSGTSNIYACGGGLAIGGGILNLRNCTFKENKITAHKISGGNTSYALGGGVSIVGGTTDTKIKNCIIAYDSGFATGSGALSVNGGGIYYQASAGTGQALIENSTILYNNSYGLYRNNPVNVQVINSIIYYNGASIFGTVNVTYSCVQGGYTGTGNNSSSPILDNCHRPLIGSPCIDAGNPNPIYNDVCFPPSAGGLRNDMGAYGGPGACNWLYTQDTCSSWPVLSINIELTALMEGLYNPVTNMMVRPQVERMYLRNATSPYAIVEPAASTIGQNGISNEFIFNSPPTGSYYLVIKNWNNLETWSKTGGELLYNDGETNYYDFTSASSQAYGNNLKLIGSKWCTYSGSVTPDSSIDLADVLQINAASNAFTTGYNINDLNGDNQVNLSDLLIVYNNSAAFVRVKNPFNP